MLLKTEKMCKTPRVRPTTGRRQCGNGADPQCDASQKMPQSQYVLNHMCILQKKKY